MPFMITEPQRVEGTKLGFSIYPYHFSFQDRFEKPRDFNQKLVVFLLKDSKYIEVEAKLYEEKFMDHAVQNNFVDKTLKKIIKANPQFVDDCEKVQRYFSKGFHAETDEVHEMKK